MNYRNMTIFGLDTIPTNNISSKEALSIVKKVATLCSGNIMIRNNGKHIMINLMTKIETPHSSADSSSVPRDPHSSADSSSAPRDPHSSADSSSAPRDPHSSADSSSAPLDPHPNTLIKIINDLNYDLVSYYINGELYYGKEYLVFNINKFKFAVYPTSFFQINTKLITSLYLYIYNLITQIQRTKHTHSSPQALDCIGDDSGNVCMMLDELFTEINIQFTKQEALVATETNIKLNNLNRNKYNLTLTSSQPSQHTLSVDLLLINPGRKGLCKYINHINSYEYIIYMSCCPGTLKKDMILLKEYKIIISKEFDMFPDNEKYNESVNLFKRDIKI
jgi:hypothetical protein